MSMLFDIDIVKKDRKSVQRTLEIFWFIVSFILMGLGVWLTVRG
jgi:predicted nucleic acid-binding Zn ribbon protein